MTQSYEAVKKIKRSPKTFTLKLSKIKIPSQIPRSELLESKYISHSVKKYITDHATIDLVYKFTINNKDYTIHFILLDEKEMVNPEKYDLYVERIMLWLHMSQSYVTGKCADKSFTVYLYLTPFEKFLPECSITVIGPDNINSGIAYACPENGEIVIYRQEEWFKVFIHESFHALGLDFSNMNQENLNKNIKIKDNIYSTTNSGRFLADGIASDLFLVNLK